VDGNLVKVSAPSGRGQKQVTTKTGDRQDDYLNIHGSWVIVLSVTSFLSVHG
jgi:hypothetical protein